MKALKVALFVKPSDASLRRDDRGMGYWSYQVDEFTWDHYSHDLGRDDLSKYQDYDLIFHEDAGFTTYTNTAKGPPVVYLAIDSTLSDDHYRIRYSQAQQANLILVDHDHLERFQVKGKSTLRFNYCVNDRIFRPIDAKNADIAFHCTGGSNAGFPGKIERARVRNLLHEICQSHGWIYRSGALGLQEYAASLAGAKVAVNVPRTPTNRPHRVFDAMACKTALLTQQIPRVDGDGLELWQNYYHFEVDTFIQSHLEDLLTLGYWEELAQKGYEMVMSNHTWAIRARELRQILSRELGL